MIVTECEDSRWRLEMGALGLIVVSTGREAHHPRQIMTLSLQDIAESIVAIAKDEGIPTSICNGNSCVHRDDGLSMGVVVAGDYDVSFYFKDSSGRLHIRRATNPDSALSIALDFIYY